MADPTNSEKFSYLHSFPDPLETLNFSLKSLDECLVDSLVVLDANVLLHPFKTGPHALDEIEKSLNRLKAENRLLVPEHALREYIANRPAKIKEFFDQLNKQRNKDYGIPSVAKLIEKVGSYPQLIEAEKKLKDEVENFRAVIASAIDEVRKWTTNDPVSKMYQNILTKDIIVSLADDLAALDKEHKDRNAKAIPPGYKDGAKGQNSIGDFLIWKTILEIGKRNPSKNLVFVSGEEKPDWVYRGSTEVLYAREELIEEYRQASGGGTFHLVDFATLLKHLKASDKAVAEVKFAEKSASPSMSILDVGDSTSNLKWSEFRQIAENAVGDWASAFVGQENVDRGDRDTGVDFIAFIPNSKTDRLIQVRTIRNYDTFEKQVRAGIPHLRVQIESGPMHDSAVDIDAYMVFVCESTSVAYYIEEAKTTLNLPRWLTVRAGVLDGEKFTPMNPIN